MRIAIGVAVAFVFAAGPGLSAASAAGKSCGVPGSKTLHVVGQVRIYAFQSHLYACSSRYGKKVFLYKHRYAEDNTRSALGNYAQSPGQTVLAYVIYPPDSPSSTLALVSRNLKTGAVLRHYVDNCPASLACGDDTITRLVTNAKGSFAWIEDDEGPGSVFAYDVTKDDSAGIKVLDDELGGAPCISPDGGPPQCNETIDLGYLVAAGGMVSWKGGPTETLQSASFN